MRFNCDSNCWSIVPKRVSTRQPPRLTVASAIDFGTAEAGHRIDQQANLLAQRLMIFRVQVQPHIGAAGGQLQRLAHESKRDLGFRSTSRRMTRAAMAVARCTTLDLPM